MSDLSNATEEAAMVMTGWDMFCPKGCHWHTDDDLSGEEVTCPECGYTSLVADTDDYPEAR